MLNVKKWVTSLFGYKYTILCLVYFYLIIYFQYPFQIIHHVINALIFFFLLHTLSVLRWGVRLFVNLIFAFLISIDAYFACVYNNPPTLNIIAAVFESNVSEAQGVMPLKNIVIAITICLSTLFLIIKSEKELTRLKFSWIYSFIIFFGFSFILIPGYIYSKSKKEYSLEFEINPYLAAVKVVSNKFPLVYNNVFILIAYQHEISRMKDYNTTARTMPDGISLDTGSQQGDTPRRIYFLMGETAWRKHFSLYDYPVRTTPFLDSLSVSDSLALHKYDAFSPASLTRDGVRLALSFATPTDTDLFYKEKNILELARLAGYETLWISNQFPVDVYDSYTGLIANSADYTFFMDYIYSVKDDLELIPEITKKIDTDKKQFFLIHMIGSHLPYELYSDSLDVYVAPQNDVLSFYDRSIHHTDRLIKEIYDIMLRDSSSVLYYVSDHGENIGVGHGFLQGGTPQFEIPMVIINNNFTGIDTIVSKYKMDNGLINSLTTPFILSETMGYKVSATAMDKVLEDSRYIIHADSKPYLYSDIEKENK